MVTKFSSITVLCSLRKLHLILSSTLHTTVPHVHTQLTTFVEDIVTAYPTQILCPRILSWMSQATLDPAQNM